MQTRVTSLILLVCLSGTAFAEEGHWVGTWAASPSPQASSDVMHKEKLDFDHQTLREVVRASIGGNTLRVRLSNAYGTTAVEIGAAHIALHGTRSGIVPGSDRVLTFGGRPAVSIPPNAPLLSDPVKLDIPAAGELVISLYLPESTTGAGIHYAAQQTAYI